MDIYNDSFVMEEFTSFSHTHTYLYLYFVLPRVRKFNAVSTFLYTRFPRPHIALSLIFGSRILTLHYISILSPNEFTLTAFKCLPFAVHDVQQHSLRALAKRFSVCIGAGFPREYSRIGEIGTRITLC